MRKNEARAFLEEIDIIPQDDSIKHTDGLSCVCSPVWDAENKWNLQLGIDNKMLIIHRRIRDALQ
jgi:hypothetical protein